MLEGEPVLVDVGLGAPVTVGLPVRFAVDVGLPVNEPHDELDCVSV